MTMTVFSFSKFKTIAFCLAASTVLILSNTGTAWSSSQTVKRIEINGAQRIEEPTIILYTDLKVGDKINSSIADKALKNLYATGLFADVNV